LPMRQTDRTKRSDKGLKPDPTTNAAEEIQRDLECRYRRFRGTLNHYPYMVTWVVGSQ